MNAANPITEVATQARFIPTERGGFIDTAALYLSADGKTVELLEWSEDLGKAKFEAAKKLASALGSEWQVASPNEWTGIFNYAKYGPATDAPIVNEWHWTRQEDPSSPSVLAFFVHLHYGSVNWDSQNSTGRVRAVRRVRASQYLNLGL